ncbi:MAG: hypothetical protein Q9170_001820 [Blastenia crenularia]
MERVKYPLIKNDSRDDPIPRGSSSSLSSSARLPPFSPMALWDLQVVEPPAGFAASQALSLLGCMVKDFTQPWIESGPYPLRSLKKRLSDEASYEEIRSDRFELVKDPQTDVGLKVRLKNHKGFQLRGSPELLREFEDKSIVLRRLPSKSLAFKAFKEDDDVRQKASVWLHVAPRCGWITAVLVEDAAAGRNVTSKTFKNIYQRRLTGVPKRNGIKFAVEVVPMTPSFLRELTSTDEAQEDSNTGIHSKDQVHSSILQRHDVDTTASKAPRSLFDPISRKVAPEAVEPSISTGQEGSSKSLQQPSQVQSVQRESSREGNLGEKRLQNFLSTSDTSFKDKISNDEPTLSQVESSPVEKATSSDLQDSYPFATFEEFPQDVGPAERYLKDVIRKEALRRHTMLASAGEVNVGGSLRQTITGNLASRSFVDKPEVSYLCIWELPTFVRRQFEIDESISNAITLTGTGTAAIAVSSIEYVSQYWPNGGPALLEAVEKLLTIKSKMSTGSDPAQCRINSLYLMIDLIEICVVGDDGTIVEAVRVRTSASILELHVEVVETLCWLAATFRSSPVEGVAESSVTFQPFRSPDASPSQWFYSPPPPSSPHHPPTGKPGNQVIPPTYLYSPDSIDSLPSPLLPTLRHHRPRARSLSPIRKYEERKRMIQEYERRERAELMASAETAARLRAERNAKQWVREKRDVERPQDEALRDGGRRQIEEVAERNRRRRSREERERLAQAIATRKRQEEEDRREVVKALEREQGRETTRRCEEDERKLRIEDEKDRLERQRIARIPRYPRHVAGPADFLVTLNELEPLEVSRICWLPLFRHTPLATQFSVPDRLDGFGLELSPALMAWMAGTVMPVEYQGGLILKGLSTALIPINECERGNAIQWHLCHTESADGLVELGDLETGAKNIDFFKVKDPAVLFGKKAFLGWCKEVQILLGSQKSNYTTVTWSSPAPEQSMVAFSGFSLGLASAGMGALGPSATMNFVVAKNQRTRFVNIEQQLADRLKLSIAKPALVYDTTTQRAWLVPTTSLLLHMMHLRYRELNKCIPSVGATMPHCNPTEEGGHGSYSILSKYLISGGVSPFGPANEWRDTLATLYTALDMALKDARDLKDKASRHDDSEIYGYELLNIVRAESPFRFSERKVQKQSGGWASIAQEVGYVLFCAGLGDALEPASSTNDLCQHWLRVPHHCDYLSAYVPCIKEILERQGRHTAGQMLQDKEYQGSLYGKCQHKRGQQCSHLTTYTDFLDSSKEASVTPSEKSSIAATSVNGETVPGNHGAIIFGKRTKLSKKTVPIVAKASGDTDAVKPSISVFRRALYKLS